MYVIPRSQDLLPLFGEYLNVSTNPHGWICFTNFGSFPVRCSYYDWILLFISIISKPCVCQGWITEPGNRIFLQIYGIFVAAMIALARIVHMCIGFLTQFGRGVSLGVHFSSIDIFHLWPVMSFRNNRFLSAPLPYSSLERNFFFFFFFLECEICLQIAK